MALLWSGSSVLVQWIYSDFEFDSPFFVTYLSNILFALYLPLWGAGSSLQLLQNPPWRRDGETVGSVLCSKGSGPTAGGRAGGAAESEEERTRFLQSERALEGGGGAGDAGVGRFGGGGERGGGGGERYSHLRTLRIGLIMTPLWFAANCSYNMSLSRCAPAPPSPLPPGLRNTEPACATLLRKMRRLQWHDQAWWCGHMPTGRV